MTSKGLKLAHPWKNTSHPEAHHGPSTLIKRFEAGAELLEIQRDGASVEDAVIRLAAWMDLAADHLTEGDEVVWLASERCSTAKACGVDWILVHSRTRTGSALGMQSAWAF